LAGLDAFATMKADRAVAVIRAERIADPVELAGALAGAGIRCVEFTLTTPGAVEALASAVDSGAVVGAGTVLDERQAREAVAAGARFVVSPAFVPDLVDACREDGVPVFLGALTPTEIHDAWAAGATAVKLFPAALGGARYLEHLRGPFPHIAFIPSGGIDERNASEYLAAGAVAVYAGSSLAPAKLVAAGDHEEIARRAHAFVASLN
jgi:2-dehydro-3-deoxyphosphogluconate aldolase / (4S)-4-hydroxy-2-oxoglutarate aldolase